MEVRRTITTDELDSDSDELIRQVRDDNVAIDISMDGEVVATIVPFRRNASWHGITEAWERHFALSKEISAAWPDGVSGAEAVSEQRREP